MEKEALKQLKSKYAILWFGNLLCTFLMLLLLAMGEVWLGLMCGAFVLICIWPTIMYGKQLKGNIPLYRTGKGFWYYRLSPQHKKTYLTVSQWVFFFLAVVFWILDLGSSVYGTSTLIGGILYIQFKTKKRIKLHTSVDDVTLYELLELGIVKAEEFVTGLYKDFETWTKVHPNAKILAMTEDRLIIVRMITPEIGDRYDVPLREIAGVYVISNGRYGQGLILTIRLSNDSSIRLSLLGNTVQDSPEQFMYEFLNTLDHAKLGTGNKPTPISPPLHQRSLLSYPSFADGVARPVIRQLDLFEWNEAPAGQAAVNFPDRSAGSAPYEESRNRRKLDF
ncbi:hypothetical protein MKZ15_22730 [Paenibacillus sp. FSL R7-0216]|uniref:hypothetical protein n=1 Tax=Paenibacillus sp. FSL R7-0216 TaxID=2921677 RepID=UPI0030D9FB5E